MHDDTAPGTHIARLAEGFEQAKSELLTGHLNETQRRNFSDLVLRAIPTQALDHAAEHEIPVRLEHHVNEVDHDDSTDVAEPELTNNLLGRLQHRLLKVQEVQGQGPLVRGGLGEVRRSPLPRLAQDAVGPGVGVLDVGAGVPPGSGSQSASWARS